MEYFKGVLDGNITEILSSLQDHQSDINDLRIQHGQTADAIANQLLLIQKNEQDISGKKSKHFSPFCNGKNMYIEKICVR